MSRSPATQIGFVVIGLVLGAVELTGQMPAPAAGSSLVLTAPYTPDQCGLCAEWNAPQQPLHLFGNTYYVGTRGLSAILITSPAGHVLIDGGLPDSAPLILDNIRSLGYRVEDVELILNSHAHHDHAAGIAALQEATGGRVAASRASAAVLERGSSGPDDPQFGSVLEFPPVRDVDMFEDGQVLRVGDVAVRALATPGHTPGGTSWSWESCEGDRCLDFVYADSLTPVSAPDFRFSDGTRYPSAVADFERSFGALEEVACDILLTPHPDASSLWERVGRGVEGLVDPGACRRYAATARSQLVRRLENERS